MARKKIEYPTDGRLKTGGEVVVLGEHTIGGIKTYRVKDTDGQERSYAVDKVVIKRG